MRREPSPHHVAGVAKTIQVLGPIVCDPSRENLRFPRERRYFVAFELTNHLQCSINAVQPRRRSDALPSLQK